MLITNHSGIVKVEGKLFIEAESAKDAVHSKKKNTINLGFQGKKTSRFRDRSCVESVPPSDCPGKEADENPTSWRSLK